ncbi:MAG: glycosyltransferase family 2 protein [Candidatus Helarchaeota archaeon]
MKLIIIIPARNEEETISQVLQEIPRKIQGIEKIETIVLNDASNDKTKERAINAGASYVLINKIHLGLARTFQKGLDKALRLGADIIVNTDGDGQYNQKEIPQLIKPILEKKADLVIGNRQIKNLKFMKAGNKYGNMLGSFVLRKLSGAEVRDASSGFRAFSRETALRINVRFNHTYTHETIIQSVFNKLLIVEIPIEFRVRQAGKSKLIHGIFKHIRNSGLIILRAILLYKPLKTLFYFGIIIMAPGILLGLRFIYFFIIEHNSGKIQSLILASILILMGFFIIILGLIGDLIANNRKLNEEILYYLKKNEFSQK